MRGDGSVYRRGGRFWIKYYRDGKPVRESGGKTEKEARRKLKARRQEILGGRYVGPKEERVTVGQLLDAYMVHLKLKGAKSQVKTESHAKAIRETFGMDRAVELTAEAVDAFVLERLESPSPRHPGKKTARATVNREVAVLRQAFNFARKRGRLTRVPYLPTLSEAPPREGFLEPSDFEAVAAELPEHLSDAARFAYATGWRKGEIVGLQWTAVDLNADPPEVRLATSKNGRPRSVPAVGDLLAIITRRREARIVSRPDGSVLLAEYVFHRNGKPLRDFRKAWRAACETAGLSGQLWHDMRRSAVRNMVRAGTPDKVAMEITGHRTRSVFDRYNIVSQTDKAEALRRTMENNADRRDRSVTPIRKRGSK